jgi:NAD(P)-dependent dehydrogenase (short-subunit alcohol dehydrogenase family)
MSDSGPKSDESAPATPSADLESLPPGYRAAVFGAGGGLGAAFVAALEADPRCGRVYAGSRDRGHPGTQPKVQAFRFDLMDEASIAAAARFCAAEGHLHLVVIATGMLHHGSLQPEKSWRSLSTAGLQQAFAINATGPALIAKHLLGHMATGDKAVFAALSARVGSIADNRLGGWHAYRASKAALNMLVRNFAIELKRRNPSALCVALHPGTVDTPLSQPFQANVPPGKLFAARQSAAHLLRVIDGLAPEHSGCLVAWDGAVIPF